jgi:hypothetical protein
VAAKKISHWSQASRILTSHGDPTRRSFLADAISSSPLLQCKGLARSLSLAPTHSRSTSALSRAAGPQRSASSPQLSPSGLAWHSCPRAPRQQTRALPRRISRAVFHQSLPGLKPPLGKPSPTEEVPNCVTSAATSFRNTPHPIERVPNCGTWAGTSPRILPVAWAYPTVERGPAPPHVPLPPPDTPGGRLIWRGIDSPRKPRRALRPATHPCSRPATCGLRLRCNLYPPRPHCTLSPRLPYNI